MGKPTFWGRTRKSVPKNKHVYTQHEIGPEKKSVFVKLPNIQRTKVDIIARKLMHFNYIYGENGLVKSVSRKYVKASDEADHLINRSSSLRLCNRQYRDRSAIKNIKKPTSHSEQAGVPESSILPSSSSVQLQSSNKGKSKYESEEWQRRCFIKYMYAALYSSDVVSEVMRNLRMTTLNSKDISRDVPRNTIFMETLRAALNVHDWVRVAKCIEALCCDFRNHDKSWLLWTGGFLSVINLCKDDLIQLAEFGKLARSLLTNYPRCFGVELATWFAQKGHFVEGVGLLEEWHEIGAHNNSRPAMWTQNPNIDNPKRNMIDLVALLYSAVLQYHTFKRDLVLFEEGTYSGDENSLYRAGERALGMFEGVMDLSEKTESDVTIFIEPLVELVSKFRSAERAKEIFKRACGRFPRNAILDEMYVNFLYEHFPSLQDEIKEKEEKLDRFNFEIDQTKRMSDDKRVKYYLKRKAPLSNAVSFKKIDNPGFSWED